MELEFFQMKDHVVFKGGDNQKVKMHRQHLQIFWRTNELISIQPGTQTSLDEED